MNYLFSKNLLLLFFKIIIITPTIRINNDSILYLEYLIYTIKFNVIHLINIST